MATANVAASHETFTIIPVAELRPEAHLVMAMPQEIGGSAGKPAFFDVGIRARAPAAEFVAGSTDVVVGTRGLKRALIQFPKSFVSKIYEYDNNNGAAEGDRVNITAGVALYDYRSGPTAEQTTIMKNLDDTSAWIRNNLFVCDPLRTTLQLGPANLSKEKAQAGAEMLNLHVVRPLETNNKSGGGGKGGAGNKRGRDGGAPAGAADAPTFARSLSCKIVPTSSKTTPEALCTYWWAANGTPMSFEEVRHLTRFEMEPFIDISGVFVNKSIRVVRMYLREAVVYPPAARPTQRYSIAFPDRVCTRDMVVRDVAPTVAAALSADNEVHHDNDDVDAAALMAEMA